MTSRRRSSRTGALALAAAALLALVLPAPGPPDCQPQPLDEPAVAACAEWLCDPTTGACAFDHAAREGAVCDDGAGVCRAGTCVCQPRCDGLVCGSDGCGGSCGACADGEVCWAVACLPVGAGPERGLDLLERVPTELRSIAAAGPHWVAASEKWLVVFDVADGETPREVGRLALPCAPIASAVSLPTAWLLCYQDAPRRTSSSQDSGDMVAVVDLSEPTAPRLVTLLRPPGPRTSIAVEGKRLYLDAVDIYDVSDPPRPRRLGGSEVGEAPVVLPGGRYAVGGRGVSVLDVSDPLDVRVVSSVPPEVGRIVGEDPYRIELGYRVKAVAWDDGLVFGRRFEAGYSLYDLSDPLAPRHLASAMGLAADDRYWRHPVALCGGFAFASIFGAGVVDVRDPLAPVNLGTYAIRGLCGGSAYRYCLSWELAVRGDTVALAYGAHGALAFSTAALDAGAPLEPSWRYRTPGEAKDLHWGAGWLAVGGRFAGVTVLDTGGLGSPTAGPERPELAGQWADPARYGVARAEAWEPPWLVQLAERRVPDDEPDVPGEDVAVVLDLTDPRRPRAVGECPIGGTFAAGALSSDWRPPSLAAAVGGVAVIATDRLTAVDFRDPTAPRCLPLPHDESRSCYLAAAGGVVFREDWGYDATASTLWVLALDDPDAPVIQPVLELPYQGRLFGLGDRLVVARYDGLVHIFDVTDPWHPVERAVHDLGPRPDLDRMDVWRQLVRWAHEV